MSQDSHYTELQQRRAKALAMGGAERLAKRRTQNVLNARERLDLLLDQDSFREFGLLSASYRPAVRDKTPADGKIAGFGTIKKRPVAVVSNDFTVLGASSSVVNGKKIKHIRAIAKDSGMPLILLGESAGARMPDRMGAEGRAILGQDPIEYLRDRRTPWVSALLGSCYGSSTWYSCLSDFVVMRKGATMAVASSRVTALAIKQSVDPEELGGWKLHTSTTGLVDVAVDTDEEALEQVKRFLSYLPSHNGEAPPVAPVPAGSDDAIKDILDIVPQSRTKTYDIREAICRILDKDSLFELKPRFGKSLVTALGRIDGKTVGIIANNPKFKGGSIDVDACAKATSFLVLCDSFNVPLVFLVDQPGFLIGIDGEKRGAPGRIMNWMNALTQVTVPKITITLRKNYGQAYLNMGGGRNSNVAAAWPEADYGFMDAGTAVNVLHGIRYEDEPERFKQLADSVTQDNAPWALAALYEIQDVITPLETRDYLKSILAINSRAPTGGIGQHRLSNWPTSY
ncbi:acyl-CoA carboxylase subunit beta [Candidimonas nitroreducens]|uniref:Methylmalonyl-CoA carboxyltransferase n=1 Tax=Candidimonas nitroreducens TaxID=683354 RepID=A0A225MWP7_9BURK|nr:carboxyl transferase domain-containing protein [Candidimonas nitroreducens]OWT64001.1 methylmalonyl-CoA carboxyltransferase [Candidimonas nitroreducens]